MGTGIVRICARRCYWKQKVKHGKKNQFVVLTFCKVEWQKEQKTGRRDECILCLVDFRFPEALSPLSLPSLSFCLVALLSFWVVLCLFVVWPLWPWPTLLPSSLLYYLMDLECVFLSTFTWHDMRIRIENGGKRARDDGSVGGRIWDKRAGATGSGSGRWGRKHLGSFALVLIQLLSPRRVAQE